MGGGGLAQGYLRTLSVFVYPRFWIFVNVDDSVGAYSPRTWHDSSRVRYRALPLCACDWTDFSRVVVRESVGNVCVDGPATCKRKHASVYAHGYTYKCTLVAPVYTLDSFFRRSSPTFLPRSRAHPSLARPPSPSLSFSLFFTLSFFFVSLFLSLPGLTVLVHVVRLPRSTCMCAYSTPHWRR